MKPAKLNELESDRIKFMNTATSVKTRDILGRPRKFPRSSGSSAEKISGSIAKFKLQLFPMDKKTRIGLENDRCYPYLELTIGVRKRISSILRRLNSKYSTSRIARGDPILLPYIQSHDLENCIWTLDDYETTAGDVRATFGRPSVLRLRYGWINQESKVNGQEESLTDFAASLEDLINYDVTREDQFQKDGLRPSPDGDAQENLSPKHDGKTKDDDNQKVAQWDDSLTNISIGGLLSEASILTCGSKFNGNPIEIQVAQLVPDSFDAYIASQAKCPPPPNYSIFDGEDTCNAFSFNPLYNKVPCFARSEETRVGVDVSRVNNGENSLGLSGIRWTDSLSGFGFGFRDGKVVDEKSFTVGKIRG